MTAKEVAAVDTGLRGSVLVIGDDALADDLERLEGVWVHRAYTAAATEGIGIDVVVCSGDYPLEELTEVRVHPRLYDRPVVLAAPGHQMAPTSWHGVDVWPVTGIDELARDELERLVQWLLCRARHPSSLSRQRAAVAS